MGLSKTSGSRDPIKRILMSTRLPKEPSHDNLQLRRPVGSLISFNELGESCADLIFILLWRVLFLIPVNNIAAPSVIPVCPNTSIFIFLPRNYSREISSRERTSFLCNPHTSRRTFAGCDSQWFSTVTHGLELTARP